MAARGGKQPREKIGKLTSEQVEIARLKRKLASEVMSKMRELLENLFKRSRDEPLQTKQEKPPFLS